MASKVHFLRGSLGSGKTTQASRFALDIMKQNSRASFVFVSPNSIAQKHLMNLIYPKLPSFSSPLSIETIDSLVNKILEAVSRKNKEMKHLSEVQYFKSQSERHAFFISTIDQLPLSTFRPKDNPTSYSSSILAYFSALNSCQVSTEEITCGPPHKELLQAYRSWNEILTERKIYDREALVSLATPWVTSLSFHDIWGFPEQCDSYLVVDDVHLFLPHQVRLISELNLLAQHTSFLLEESMMSYSKLHILPVLESSLHYIQSKYSSNVVETSSRLVDRLKPVQVKRLLPKDDEIQALIKWAHTTSSTKGKQRIICTRSKQDQLILFEQCAARGLKVRSMGGITRRVDDQVEVQCLFAFVHIVLHPRDPCEREWFLLFTKQYKATGDQIKRFGQLSTRQRMDAKSILSMLSATDDNAKKLLADMKSVQTLFVQTSTSLGQFGASWLCQQVLQKTQVHVEDYSPAMEALERVFAGLKRLEWKGSKSMSSPPTTTMEALYLLLKGEAEEEDIEEAEESFNNAENGDHILLATMQWVCANIPVSSVDSLCIARATENRLPAAQHRMAFPLPLDLLNASPDGLRVQEVSHRTRELNLLRTLCARSKTNSVVYTHEEKDRPSTLLLEVVK